MRGGGVRRRGRCHAKVAGFALRDVARRGGDGCGDGVLGG